MSYTEAPTEEKRKFVCNLKLFSFVSTVLLSMDISGFAAASSRGRAFIVASGTYDQEGCLVPEFVCFFPEGSLPSLEETLFVTNAYYIGRVPMAEGSSSCYFLNGDLDIPSMEEGNFLCIDPELQADGTANGEGDGVTDSYEAAQAGAQWFCISSPVWSIDDGTGSFVQQLSSLLSSLWQWLMSSDNFSEKREKNSTSSALPESPSSTPERALRLSGGGFPPDPPTPPPFMPGIPGKGLLNMPDWQFDYLLALAGISQRAKQWFHNGYLTTSNAPRQFVSDTDLSAALTGISQKKAINKSLFSQVPLDASELLAQLSGKGLPGFGQVHQPETVMLYPVFMLPQSDSNDFEEAQEVEYAGKTCSVCLLNFEQSDDVVKTSCLHLFHMDCMRPRLTTEANGQINLYCPICRHDLSALSRFLIRKEILKEALKEMQEVTHLLTEMLLGRGTWPENDRSVYERLIRAGGSNDPDIAEQIQALWPLVNFYSVRHLVSQVQAGRATWPENDGHIFLELRMAEGINDPDIAEQARALLPSVSFYSLQHLMSHIEAGRRPWPDDDRVIALRLRTAQDSNDPAIVEQSRALKPTICLHFVQHLVSQMQAGTGVWPEDDHSVFVMLNIAILGTDATTIEAWRVLNPDSIPTAGRARALYPLANLYSAKHLISQVQAGKKSWPGDESHLHLGSLRRLVDSPDPVIAEQARAIYPLANLYASQYQVAQIQARRERWPDDDRYIHKRLGIAKGSNDPAIAEQAEALEPLINFYSVRHFVSLVQAGKKFWPDEDSYIYTRLRSAQGCDDPVIAEQARALEPAVNLCSVQDLVSQMQIGRRTCWPEDDNNVYARLSNAEGSNDRTVARRARALRPLVDQYKSKSSGN